MRRALPSTVLAGLIVFAAPAFAADLAAPSGAPGWRNQSGSLNYAPRPGSFVVVAVDEYRRLVRLRSPNGWEGDVVVDERIHDLSSLKPGDALQVDFFVPDEAGDPLAAATIWPMR
jgi:hypothetical protein